MTPSLDYVLLKKVEVNQTAAGLLLPEGAKSTGKPMTCTIVAKGPDCSPFFNVGDEVVHTFDANQIAWMDQDGHRIIRECFIVAKV